MKKVISSQAVMDNGKVTFSGLFNADGVPAEIELICEDGCALMSVYSLEADETTDRRGLTEDELEGICTAFKNCGNCPLFEYCEEEDV